MPDNIFSFLVDGYATLKAEFPDKTWAQLCGLIIAAPFELWNWHELAGVPASDFAAWRRVSFQDEAAQITNLPVDVVNDATAACRAEHVFDRGRNFRDYVYFLLGHLSGGIVLDNSAFEVSQKKCRCFWTASRCGYHGQARPVNRPSFASGA